MSDTNDDSRSPIAFLGAGPGAPDLMTIRGRRLLEEARLVVYAGSLVNEAVLAWTGEECRTVSSAPLTLEEILDTMIEAHQSGERVVRLHSGDPAIYGAIQEQMAVLEERNIACEVVPGVSSFTAAAAALGSQLTLPETAQTIILSRAAGRARAPQRERLDRLARTRSTLCIFLSAKHAQSVQDQLLEHYPPETPAAVCYRVTWPDEKLLRTRLDRLAATTRDHDLKRTTLFLVGEAIGGRQGRSGVYDPDHKHVFRPT